MARGDLCIGIACTASCATLHAALQYLTEWQPAQMRLSFTAAWPQPAHVFRCRASRGGAARAAAHAALCARHAARWHGAAQ